MPRQRDIQIGHVAIPGPNDQIQSSAPAKPAGVSGTKVQGLSTTPRKEPCYDDQIYHESDSPAHIPSINSSSSRPIARNSSNRNGGVTVHLHHGGQGEHAGPADSPQTLPKSNHAACILSISRRPNALGIPGQHAIWTFHTGIHNSCLQLVSRRL